tara:strand:- start:472 stop:714 length:243 start_codon:yes stop_codon:yes gene_type:complete
MIANLFYLALLLIGFPLGLFLAKLCKEEIKKWRKRLFIMSISALVLAVVVSFLRFDYKIPTIMTLFFIIITNLTIIWKSY